MATAPLHYAPAQPTRPSTASARPHRSAQRSGWAWTLGRLAGIEVRVHATFLILLGWVAASHFLQGHGAREALAGLLYVTSVFGIVVLHELGHALMARRYGIATRDITLLPIGGIARLERLPSDPKQELLVAIAGPAVNVALAAVLLGVLAVLGSPPIPSTLAVVGGPFVAKLMWTNVGLAVVNFIPAFPMDGGRVLRAMLALRRDPVRATDIAARVGQGIALLFGLIGLFANPFLVFIALFVWIGAQEEAAMAHLKADLAGIRVGQAMVTRFATVAPHEPLGRAAQLILAGFQHDLPVVEGTRLAGWLTRDEALRSAFAAGSAGAPVSSVMQREVPSIRDDDPLEHALEVMQSADVQSVPVLHDDAVVGVLPIQNVAYVLQARERMRHRLAA